MEITLIFPSCKSTGMSEDEVKIAEYKNQAFSLWKEYVHGTSKYFPNFEEILPSNCSPISLGQLCLATYLSKRGVKVNYIHCDYYLSHKDFSSNDLKRYIVQVSKTAQVVGIYSMTPMISDAMDIIEYVKSSLPNSTTVLGGPHGTYTDIECLNRYPYLDVVSRGEGEEVLFRILQHLEGKCSLDNIPGITYRSAGGIKRNNDQELLCACDIPAPNYNLLPKNYNCLLTVMYSRGCPYSCKFCAEGGFWRHVVRFRDPKDIVAEIRYISTEWKQRIIHIADSEIDASPQKLTELVDCIERSNIECKYTVNLRCDAYKRLTPNLIERMKRIGVVGYLIGVESASDSMLAIMGRRSCFTDFIKTIDFLNLHQAGFILPGVMLGFPGETQETLSYTKRIFLELLKEKRVDYFFPKVFIPYPGSEPFSNPTKYGIEISHKWEDFARYSARQPFKSNLISADLLEKEMFGFYEDIINIYKHFLGVN